MISVIITTYNEPESLYRAVEAIFNENLSGFEVLVVGPDIKTEKVVKDFQKKFSNIFYLKDEAKGKPVALNLAFKKARGEILILTDGDVLIKKNSLKYLLEPFKDNKIGAVSGRPVSLNNRNNLFGYWSHFLTNAAHQMRLKSKIWPCSGYLYAIRHRLVQKIPEDIFSDDAYITEVIRNKGYKISYAPEAKVCVKYPTNFRDWLKQKVRSTGGYVQKLKIKNKKLKVKTRGICQEIFGGLKLFFTYPKNLKEFCWTILLYLARIYLWLLIFFKIKILRQEFSKIWQRVESTK